MKNISEKRKHIEVKESKIYRVIVQSFLYSIPMQKTTAKARFITSPKTRTVFFRLAFSIGRLLYKRAQSF
jgi:hypothetical protein